MPSARTWPWSLIRAWRRTSSRKRRPGDSKGTRFLVAAACGRVRPRHTSPEGIKSGGCVVLAVVLSGTAKRGLSALETRLAIYGNRYTKNFEETRQMADLQQLEDQIVGLS